MDKKLQLVSLDLLRILSGIGVVFIHVSDHFILFNDYVGGISWWMLYILNVYTKVAAPIFMLISGYLLLFHDKLSDKRNFYLKRLRRIGVPTMIWISFFFVWQALFEKVIITPQFVFRKIYEVNFGPLYFLIVILELYILAPIFLKLLQKFDLVFLGGMALLSLLTGFIPRFLLGLDYDVSESLFTIWIPFAFYFVVGGYFRINKIRINSIVAFLAFLLLGVATVYLSDMKIGSGIISYSSPTLMAMSIIFFMLVNSYEKQLGKIQENLKKLVVIFASTVFGVYLSHPFIINVTNRLTDFRPGEVLSPIWLNVIFISIGITIISMMLVLIVKKLPFGKYIVG